MAGARRRRARRGPLRGDARARHADRARRDDPVGGAVSVLLAFDTATPDTVVGLRTADGATLGRRHRPADGERPGHVTQLLPLLTELLDEAGVGWDAVARIGVGVGPGTFTGLRIGVASARSLAAAGGAELVGVPTLAALAAAAPAGRVVAALDARRREIFAAAWDDATAAAAGAAPSLPPVAVPPAELGGLVALAGVRVVGDGAVRYREALTAAGALVAPDDDAQHAVDPARLCDLAARATPGADVLPAYVRRPDAVPTALRGGR
ncbi:tRNA (adenosine(37)-N6)-threonylcarbamoyltransferase complex dimerization subunit type 1 TsaB [Paraconexibacter algicola]|uniref:tRNA (Adenosine(37)-N6)-threonylcarbamoyltransferase complex dimerization subunit type 1 TsaB n=1 Tax=Paraconexibacter algicola TaxID=2133960 RepID=A0A2T4UEP4_9ACTN|nr:tRNA (adenosine(37)-N6)-threonylcarbamoyltransferase complex dimerization subunit type 1 TsaB [Paraconexibacter algicola]